MKKKAARILGITSLLAFVIWTILLGIIDVDTIGPMDSKVGFARLNGYFHSLTSVNMHLYTITDWLGLVPITVALLFAMLGLGEWIKRKRILAVDQSILTLGAFYIIVIAVYIFFEEVPINYRPTLIDGYLEVSYPSSTTLLTLTVMPTAAIEFNLRIKNAALRKSAVILALAFTLFMVVARLISGVHWLTDIIGGILVSLGLVALYYSLSDFNS